MIDLALTRQDGARERARWAARARHGNAHVLVIGAGVTGLTTALVLVRRGRQVTVLADRFAPDVVSTVAGALWEWPPSVCGRHHDEPALDHAAGWAMTSYQAFARLSANPHTGVFVRPAIFYFRHRVDDNPAELAKMRQVAEHVPGFVHDPALISHHGVSPAAGVIDAYSHLAPMIDTDRYLAWLQAEALAAGCRLVSRRIHGTLAAQEQPLLDEFAADAIINCSGLGSAELAADAALDPHRGAVLRLVNDGRERPRITIAHAVANDVTSDTQDMIFILPRGEDRLLVGGIVEPGKWDTDVDLGSYPPLQDMLARCVSFLPSLAGLPLDQADPLRVGLRPYRAGKVRLEAEPGTRIVHNYGHGGAGVTLSWGCAHDAADLAERFLVSAAA